MGFDLTSLNALFLALSHVKNKENVLTIGRQGIHISYSLLYLLGKKYGFDIKPEYFDTYCEKMLKGLDFKNVDSVDNSDYEKATIIHNMNLPLSLDKKYDFILDCGTAEHIFNIPQVFENVIHNLNKDGIYLYIGPNNNFSGHGFYQFSPEIFYRSFTKEYGMEIVNIYLAVNNTLFPDWVEIKMPTKENNRMEYKFDTREQVYIIVIAKKISEERKRLTKEFPNQYSYEEVEWKEN